MNSETYPNVYADTTTTTTREEWGVKFEFKVFSSGIWHAHEIPYDSHKDAIQAAWIRQGEPYRNVRVYQRTIVETWQPVEVLG